MEIDEKKANPSTVVEERLDIAKQKNKIENIQEVNKA